MHRDQVPVGIVGLEEARGALRPRHVARQVEAIPPVRVRLVFVGEGPQEDVIERAVTREQVAQPEALARGRPEVRVGEGPAIEVQQDQLHVHAVGSAAVASRRRSGGRTPD